jgi:hypothetical protein
MIFQDHVKNNVFLTFIYDKYAFVDIVKITKMKVFNIPASHFKPFFVRCSFLNANL